MTAAELLSVAAFDAGHHAQAFPSFGSERTGAPVVAYCRIDDAPIRTREPIVTPDALIIQDVTLLPHADVLSGLPADAYVLLNSEHTPQQLGLADFVAGHRADRIVNVPATQIALDHIGRPVPNVVLLGGFAALTGVITMAGLELAVAERFHGRLVAGNQAAAIEAFERVSAATADVTDRGVMEGAVDATAD